MLQVSESNDSTSPSLNSFLMENGGDTVSKSLSEQDILEERGRGKEEEEVDSRVVEAKNGIQDRPTLRRKIRQSFRSQTRSVDT